MGRMATGSRAGRKGFTIRDLAVVLSVVVVAGGLLASVAGMSRNLSFTTVCASNLHTWSGGLEAYVAQYNSYPPHNPYPAYPVQRPGSLETFSWDPSLGWLMTYGLSMEPPRWHIGGHFDWTPLDELEMPSICLCPATRMGIFSQDPEIDAIGAYESFIFRYAASYQTSGMMRAATTVRTLPQSDRSGEGGRNPAIPYPSPDIATSHPCVNASSGIPYVWLQMKPSGSPPDDPQASMEVNCWVQAVHPAEVQDPSRLYYLADSRDYRPTPGAWPAAASNDGWPSAYGNKVFLGTRHSGFANVLYLDGAVTRDNQMHMPQWNMDYDASTQQARSTHWRCATFATDIPLANIRTQAHIMPVLMVKGWEYFFDADGVKPQ